MRPRPVRPSVLVCDDDRQSIRALRAVLREAGVAVSVASGGEAALTQAALRVPDAAIIEMDLGDSSGAEICRRLREWSSIPLIMLSYASDEARVVEAFDAGADDYIVKPFRPREIVARLQAQLRRATRDAHEPVILHGLEVDLATRLVHRDGQEIRLTPIEYKLLSVLVGNRGRLMTHDALLRQVWGVAYAEDRQTLRAHMANLRRKLGLPRTGGAIHTYPGVGYLFGDLASSPPTQPPAAQSLRPLPGLRAA
jgi:two-component system, OmpR family, KDP operon response regulator KdpE